MAGKVERTKVGVRASNFSRFEFLERIEKGVFGVPKKFEPTERQRILIEKALARMDAKRRAKQTAAAARSKATKERRQREKREAKQETARGIVPNIFRKGPKEAERKLALGAGPVVLARMEPGAWYARRDLVRLMPEYALGTVKTQIWQMLQNGLIERAGNPDFELRPDDNPMRNDGRYVYGLTTAGQEAGQDARKRLGWCSDTRKE